MNCDSPCTGPAAPGFPSRAACAPVPRPRTSPVVGRPGHAGDALDGAERAREAVVIADRGAGACRRLPPRPCSSSARRDARRHPGARGIDGLKRLAGFLDLLDGFGQRRLQRGALRLEIDLQADDRLDQILAAAGEAVSILPARSSISSLISAIFAFSRCSSARALPAPARASSATASISRIDCSTVAMAFAPSSASTVPCATPAMTRPIRDRIPSVAMTVSFGLTAEAMPTRTRVSSSFSISRASA